MIQKLMIDVESTKPLNEYGDGHVLLYNKRDNNYYVTTRESLFAVQDAKIKELQEKYNDFEKKVSSDFKSFKTIIEKKYEQELKELQKENSEFKDSMVERETNFLYSYQETNAKLIDMVKKVIIEE